MKQMISVRSNTHYTQEENGKEFELKPMMELIMIYANGKELDLDIYFKSKKSKP